MWGLKLSIFFSHSSPKPVITLLTMMTAATPSITPRIETQVMTDATERFGLRYLVARKTEKLTEQDCRVIFNAEAQRRRERGVF